MRDKTHRKNKAKVDELLLSIKKQLSNIDSEIALEYLNWIGKKTLYLNQSINKIGYGAQPDNLSRGDIVWVEFGINVGTELSDYKTHGHYALVWAIDLGNVIVIPLSSRDAPGSLLTFDLGIIEGLNDKNELAHSYLKLDAIRSVSKRRIARMNGRENGKLTLDDAMIEKVKMAIQMAFLN